MDRWIGHTKECRRVIYCLYGVIQFVNEEVVHVLGAGVHIEYYCIVVSDYFDFVVQDRFCRVGAGGNRVDHFVWSSFI